MGSMYSFHFHLQACVLQKKKNQEKSKMCLWFASLYQLTKFLNTEILLSQRKWQIIETEGEKMSFFL